MALITAQMETQEVLAQMATQETLVVELRLETQETLEPLGTRGQVAQALRLAIRVARLRLAGQEKRERQERLRRAQEAGGGSATPSVFCRPSKIAISKKKKNEKKQLASS